jgi:Tol biopolymer transport system component
MPVGGEDDGELIRILTSQELAWTAGGDRVALLGAPESLDLFLIDLAARQVIRLTEDDGYESWPQWSPNGQYLAYKTTDPRTGAQAVFVFDAGTQQSTQVDVEPIRAALELGAGSAFAFVGELIWVSDTRLVFYPQANQRSGGIWLHDVATSVTQDILSDPIDDPAWSAEARAWVYSVPDEPGNLWMLRLDDPKPAQLVKGQAYAPVWSPDGQAIVYSWSNPESIGWDLRVVDLAGNDRTLVPNAALIQRSPSEPGPAGKRYWSPDGQFVVYATIGRDYGRAEQTEGYGGEAGPDLENWWMVSVRGGEPRRMTDMQKAFYLQEPALSPDGTVWAYIGFSYVDRLQHLYTIPLGGGHPERVDAGVRWFGWLP